MVVTLPSDWCRREWVLVAEDRNDVCVEEAPNEDASLPNNHQVDSGNEGMAVEATEETHGGLVNGSAAVSCPAKTLAFTFGPGRPRTFRNPHHRGFDHCRDRTNGHG